MKSRLFSSPYLIFFLFLPLSFSCNKDKNVTWLFNNSDLTGWETYLGIPDSSQTVPGLEKDGNGNYTQALGLNHDPLRIFSVVDEDGEPAIRIDGYVWGCLVTKEEYENYHLHLEFKWGDEKHPPRENLDRNSGLCYHSVGDHGVFWTYWMRSFELEIKETALGDFVRVDNVFATIETGVDISLTISPRLRYERGGHPVEVNSVTYMVRAARDCEKPHGEWNSIDLYVLDDKAVHLVNEELVLVATDLNQDLEGSRLPLTRGKIQLQSEGAEVFYRNIWLEPVTQFPESFNIE